MVSNLAFNFETFHLVIDVVKKHQRNNASGLHMFRRNVMLDKKFRAHFGVPLAVSTELWTFIGHKACLSEFKESKNWLWGNIFLKFCSRRN